MSEELNHCPLTWAIQRLNSTPYSLTKAECVDVLRGLRDEIRALTQRPAAQADPGYLDRLIDALLMPPAACSEGDLRKLQRQAAEMLELMRSTSQPAAQATPEPVSRSRECTEPMCACMGGPCAECPEGEREKEIADLRTSRDFYKRRADALQQAQSHMRDPERTMVCDILANGALLVPAGDRYAATPEQVGEPALWVLTKQLDQRETTTRGYLWFSNPHNDSWTPLYTRPAPGVPDVEGLRDRLVAISAAVADCDDRAAQSMLGEILRLLAAAQAKGADK